VQTCALPISEVVDRRPETMRLSILQPRGLQVGYEQPRRRRGGPKRVEDTKQSAATRGWCRRGSDEYQPIGHVLFRGWRPGNRRGRRSSRGRAQVRDVAKDAAGLQLQDAQAEQVV